MSIIKKPTDDLPSFSITKDDAGKIRIGSKKTPFQQRTQQAKERANDAAMLPNRLCLMLDKSSSMCGSGTSDYNRPSTSKISLLHEAIEAFVNRCNLSDTAIALETFPHSVELALTNVGLIVITTAQSINASGDTPMRQCVELCLSKIPMTRGIIVSDGEATDWRDRYLNTEDEGSGVDNPDELLLRYKAAGVPIDCVHIGDSTSGEALLRRIAKLTGGIYIKFTDVSSFARNFGYLAPGYRAMLTDGRISAEDLGASEVNR